MDAPCPAAVFADPAVGPVPEWVPGCDSNIPAAAAVAVECDVVRTRPDGRPWIPSAPKPAGRQPRALVAGADRARVIGHETKRELIRLRVVEGKSLRECARLMGRNYKALHAVWRVCVAEACGEGEESAEMRRSVRHFLDRGFRHLWETSVPLVAESAAHGAVALKALEGLGKMHGIVGPEPGADAAGAATLAEIGASVRLVSPLLADKIERVRALAVRAEE